MFRGSERSTADRTTTEDRAEALIGQSRWRGGTEVSLWGKLGGDLHEGGPQALA